VKRPSSSGFLRIRLHSCGPAGVTPIIGTYWWRYKRRCTNSWWPGGLGIVGSYAARSGGPPEGGPTFVYGFGQVWEQHNGKKLPIRQTWFGGSGRLSGSDWGLVFDGCGMLRFNIKLLNMFSTVPTCPLTSSMDNTPPFFATG
jgi:hypothetical protein